MNRQDFYLNLALELNNLKVPPELINTHIDQFKQYLQTLSEADAEKQIASFGDVKALASNIYRLLCGGEDAPAPAKKAPVKAEEESVYDAFRVEHEEDEDIVTLLEDTSISADNTVDISQIDDSPINTPAPSEAKNLPEPEPIREEPSAAEKEQTDGEQIELDFGIYDKGGYITPDPAAFGDEIPAADTIIMEMPETAAPPKPLKEPEEEEEEPFTEFTFNDLPKRKERSTGGLVLFYSLFIITLPVTLTLFLVSMALFGVTYLVLGVATGLFFTLIFGTAVAGALFALSGGLYGIGQINAGGSAIGLFELGLALIIVGVTILVCFLFSMIALKWLPALLRYLTVFLRFYLRKLLTLIKYLKGRCEQL